MCAEKLAFEKNAESSTTTFYEETAASCTPVLPAALTWSEVHHSLVADGWQLELLVIIVDSDWLPCQQKAGLQDGGPCTT
jgi:hypothetical protein